MRGKCLHRISLSYISCDSYLPRLRRRFLKLIYFFLLPLTLLISLTLGHAQSVKDISSQLAKSITQSGKKTVAVVDFTDLQGRVTEFGRFLAEEISVDLAGAHGSFKVIDRTNLKTILQEHKLASTGIIDPQTARKVGEITGVQALVAGTITPLGDTLRVSVKVLDSETAEIISGATTDLVRNKSIDELLAKGIAGEVQPAHNVEKTEPEQRKYAADVKFGNFEIVIKECRPRSDPNPVKCEGTISNHGSTRAEFSVAMGKSYMVDNLGHQSNVITVGLGAATSHSNGGDHISMMLEPELPVIFKIGGWDMGTDAESTSIFLVTSEGQGLIRNIRLHGR